MSDILALQQLGLSHEDLCTNSEVSCPSRASCYSILSQRGTLPTTA